MLYYNKEKGHDITEILMLYSTNIMVDLLYFGRQEATQASVL